MDLIVTQGPAVVRISALSAALVPAVIFWIVISLRKSNRYLVEMIGVSFGLGVVIASPSSLLAFAIDSFFVEQIPYWWAAILRAFAAAAIPEEIAKFLVFYYFALRHHDFRKPSNAVWAAVAVGLGFAAIENVFYVFDSSRWHAVALMRALTAVPSHGFDGLLMGYFAALALSFPEKRRLYLTLALALPIAAHGLYDSVLFVGEIFSGTPWINDPLEVVFVGFLLVELIVAVILIRRVSKSKTLAQDLSATR